MVVPSEILPLLLCADGFFLANAGALLGRLARRFSRSRAPGSASPARRPAYSPAERFLPCHRLALVIPRP